MPRMRRLMDDGTVLCLCIDDEDDDGMARLLPIDDDVWPVILDRCCCCWDMDDEK